MKKTILLLLFIGMFIPYNLLAQKDLSGTYYGEPGGTIKIEGDNFYYIIRQQYDVRYRLIDTLLNAKFKRVEDHFIELNSPYIPFVLAHEVKVTQSFDPNLQDSTRIAFSIPYNIGNLKIAVYTYGNVVSASKTFSLIYSEDRKELYIPSNLKSISFRIEPTSLIQQSFENLYYGVTAFDSINKYHINEQDNSVLIEIPAIDDGYFERYVVLNEYVRVKGRKIYWRGYVYKKSKD